LNGKPVESWTWAFSIRLPMVQQGGKSVTALVSEPSSCAFRYGAEGRRLSKDCLSVSPRLYFRRSFHNFGEFTEARFEW
jgi:hypothetical protein